MPRVKPKYQTIAGREDANDDDGIKETVNDDDDDDTTPNKKGEPLLEVIILDFTHSRFTVPLPNGPATSTVLDLKVAGSRHHSVAANQQRLIYQGKLLSDEQATLRACGITHGSIVHLFPKPRVVVVNQQPPPQGGTAAAADSNAPSSSPAAVAEGRVPTIVVDEAEHLRRGQILVLGSADYMEAVNNVKLFSFMLLIISTIELLNLIAVALGEGDPSMRGSSSTSDPIPYQEHDDFFPNDDDPTDRIAPVNIGNETSDMINGSSSSSSGTPYVNPYQTWSSLSWVDLVVSVLGIYVALLGIRASNDNALVVARLYLIGTCVTAVGWLVYNFIVTFEIDEEMQREAEMEQQGQGGGQQIDPHPSMPMNNGNNNSNDSVFNQAVQAMVIPAVVWGLCIFRAWQFQFLLAEAEQEAVDRIQAEGRAEREAAQGGGESDDDDHGDDEERALQSPTAPSPRIIS